MKKEIISITYGCMVRKIIEDSEGEVDVANQKLELIGYNMGQRMIDEFLATNEIEVCKNFSDVS